MRRATDEIEERARDENRVTGSLAGLALALGLVAAGLFLIHGLQSKARVEDCLLSGRTNCDGMLAGR